MSVSADTRMPRWRAFKTFGSSAQDVLDTMGLRAPVDVFGLIRDLGISLHFERDATYAGASEVIAGEAHIWVRASDPMVRKRFTAGHELGHILKHDGRQFRDYIFSAGYNHHEQEANRFAAELLMPDWQVRVIAQQTKGDVAEMARFFNVSEAAMGIRFAEVYGRTK